jgi:D-lactate dehydrogenase (quinone)
MMQGIEVLAQLAAIVGAAHVLTNEDATRPYRTGFRGGVGQALAVVRPGSLVEQWRVLVACVAANRIIVMQASNTSLTGGSTPAASGYDRDVVLVNTSRITACHLIAAGQQAICLPGTTLHQLERALAPLGREPHSVIGSSCLGASVIGGVCNNSGGALVRRGPAYTQLALFARVDEHGIVRLVNHLGIRLGEDPEEMLRRVERGAFEEADVEHDPEKWGSDREYGRHVRDIDADSPARFNANPQRLFEASGCAGRVMVFAVRLDTFPKDAGTRVFYIGTQDVDELAQLRRHILARFEHLPIAAEYLHRDMFDVADAYGKDTFLLIRLLGTDRLPRLFALKSAVDAFMARCGLGNAAGSERALQRLSSLLPDHLPQRMRRWRDRFAHHLLLKVALPGIDEAARHLRSIFPSPHGDFFECSEKEAKQAFLHRFVAAGAAVRYRAVHAAQVGDIVALDLALRRNDRNWFEMPPEAIRGRIHLSLYYGHFLCHVFHHDYILRGGTDPLDVEHQLWRWLDARQAEYPAEHNVGHLYRAKAALADFYRLLDPRNQLNPGIGGTSKGARWRDDSESAGSADGAVRG